jgi:hypothetical protein
VLTTANAAGTNGLTCLPKHGGARHNNFFGHPFQDWPLRPVLSFRDRTPSALTARPPSSSIYSIFIYVHSISKNREKNCRHELCGKPFHDPISEAYCHVTHKPPKTYHLSSRLQFTPLFRYLRYQIYNYRNPQAFSLFPISANKMVNIQLSTKHRSNNKCLTPNY